MPNFFLSHKRPKVAGRMAPPPLRHGRRGAPPDLRPARRDPAQGPPNSAAKLPPGQSGKRSGAWGVAGSNGQMKLFTGWAVLAGLILAATAANAQTSRYSLLSDVDGPYAAIPPEAPPPRYG